MDRKTWQVAGALFVIVPVLWSAGSTLISLYDTWNKTQSAIEQRLDKLERYKCAMGTKPPETINWKRKPVVGEPGECIVRGE